MKVWAALRNINKGQWHTLELTKWKLSSTQASAEAGGGSQQNTQRGWGGVCCELWPLLEECSQPPSCSLARREQMS